MHRKASAALDVSLRIEKKKFRPLVTWVCRSFPQPAARHGGAQGRCRGLCALRRGTPRRGQPRAGAAARVPQRARAGPCGGVVQRVWCLAARVAGCAGPRGAGARRRVVETVRLARCRRAARGRSRPTASTARPATPGCPAGRRAVGSGRARGRGGALRGGGCRPLERECGPVQERQGGHALFMQSTSSRPCSPLIPAARSWLSAAPLARPGGAR